MLMPSMAEAQENVIKAIKTFNTDKALARYITRSSFTDNDTKTGKAVKSYTSYSFRLPASRVGALEKIAEAFRKDKKCAYKFYDISDGWLSAIFMDDTDVDSSSMSGDDGDNMMKVLMLLVNDKNDSTMRHRYSLTWHKDTADNIIEGCLTHDYGVRPPELKLKKPTVIINGLPEDRYMTTSDSTSDKKWDKTAKMLRELPKRLKGIKIRGNSYITIGGKRMWISKAGDQDGVSLSDIILKSCDGTDPVECYTDSMMTGSDVLKAFSTLRTEFKTNMRMGDISNTDKNTTLVSKIYRLCKNHGELLSTEESKLCRKELKDMSKEIPDSYLSGLLKESARFLKNQQHKR